MSLSDTSAEPVVGLRNSSDKILVSKNPMLRVEHPCGGPCQDVSFSCCMGHNHPGHCQSLIQLSEFVHNASSRGGEFLSNQKKYMWKKWRISPELADHLDQLASENGVHNLSNFKEWLGFSDGKPSSGSISSDGGNASFKTATGKRPMAASEGELSSKKQFVEETSTLTKDNICRHLLGTKDKDNLLLSMSDCHVDFDPAKPLSGCKETNRVSHLSLLLSFIHEDNVDDFIIWYQEDPNSKKVLEYIPSCDGSSGFVVKRNEKYDPCMELFVVSHHQGEDVVLDRCTVSEDCDKNDYVCLFEFLVNLHLGGAWLSCIQPWSSSQSKYRISCPMKICEFLGIKNHYRNDKLTGMELQRFQHQHRELDLLYAVVARRMQVLIAIDIKLKKMGKMHFQLSSEDQSIWVNICKQIAFLVGKHTVYVQMDMQPDGKKSYDQKLKQRGEWFVDHNAGSMKFGRHACCVKSKECKGMSRFLVHLLQHLGSHEWTEELRRNVDLNDERLVLNVTTDDDVRNMVNDHRTFPSLFSDIIEFCDACKRIDGRKIRKWLFSTFGKIEDGHFDTAVPSKIDYELEDELGISSALRYEKENSQLLNDGAGGEASGRASGGEIGEANGEASGEASEEACGEAQC